MARISIIIPAFNEEDTLPLIIKNLRKQASKNFEIIVIDNNSSDKTFQVAKRLADKVYKCKEQGISYARNYGAKMSRSEIVAFLDADSAPCETWARRLEEHFNKDDNLTAISGMDLYEYDNFIKRKFLNAYSRFCFFVVRTLIFLKKPIIISNNFAIKRDIYNMVGGLDNLIVEDYYFGLKLKTVPGVKCSCDSRMKVILSGRRFEKKGIFSTIFLWTKAIFKKIPQTNYAIKYKPNH